MHSPLSPTPRRPSTIPLLFFIAGAGMVGWYGQQWYELPKYNEQDVELSVTANLAMDLQRLGPHFQQDPARIEKLRAQIRKEVEADLGRERKEVEQGLGIGLMLLVVSLGHAILMRGLRKPA